jgi:hypothetical protein
MAKQTINLGSGDSRGDGESIRTAFDKCNDNFDELYTAVANITIPTVPTDISELTDTTNLLTSGSYNDLTDKPTIPTVPTTVSSFTNDSGYITGYTVTESDVTAHQAALTITESQISDLTHFSGSYNDLTDKPDLTDYATIAQGVQGAAAFSWGDHSTAGYLRSVSEAAVTAHQAALTITESQISDLTHFSGSYTDLTNKPTIPSDIGDLTDTGSLLTSGTPLTQIKTETGDYTLTSNDHGYYIRMNNSGNATVTLVADSVEAIPVGTTIVVGRTTANSVEFAAGAGATVYSPASLVIAEQWAKVTVLKVAANTWEIEGNLAP